MFLGLGGVKPPGAWRTCGSLAPVVGGPACSVLQLCTQRFGSCSF